MSNVLIHESRRIRVPVDTLVDAVLEFEHKKGRWPSTLAVTGARIDDNDASCLTLSLQQGEQGAVAERKYSRATIAAIIVNYCLTMHVPLPRHASKSIEVQADGITLLFQSDLMLNRRHAEMRVPFKGAYSMDASATSAATTSADVAADAAVPAASAAAAADVAEAVAVDAGVSA